MKQIYEIHFYSNNVMRMRNILYIHCVKYIWLLSYDAGNKLYDVNIIQVKYTSLRLYRRQVRITKTTQHKTLMAKIFGEQYFRHLITSATCLDILTNIFLGINQNQILDQDVSPFGLDPENPNSPVTNYGLVDINFLIIRGGVSYIRKRVL